jgi:hypothetical protein
VLTPQPAIHGRRYHDAGRRTIRADSRSRLRDSRSSRFVRRLFASPVIVSPAMSAWSLRIYPRIALDFAMQLSGSLDRI